MSDVNKNLGPSAQDPQAGLPATGTPAPQVGDTDPSAPQAGSTVPLAALHEEREKRQALAAETQALKEQLQNLQYMVTQAPPSAGQQYGTVYPQHQPPQQQGINQQLNELWEQDPRKAVQAELMMGLQWYDQVNSSLDAQEAQAAAKHPDFEKYRSEVRRYVRALPAQDRAKQGIVDLAYYACRGQKVDDIVQARQQELLEKIKKGEQVQGFDYQGVSTPPPTQKKALTDEQRKVADAMGMAHDEYLRYLK